MQKNGHHSVNNTLKNTSLNPLIVILILLFSLTSVAQQSSLVRTVSNETNQVEIPKRLERKFKRDAARLALRMNAEEEDLRYQSIVISRNSIENFYTILTKIYLEHETAKSIAKCNVHTFPNPSIDHFVIIFDKTIAWAEPLQQGISETDSPEINDLLDDFDLIIEKHVQWNDEHDAITIRSKEPLNMAALANEFYNVKGVTQIDLGVPQVGGNDIQVSRIQNGWEVKYVLKFGSHITGDGKQHIWTYKALDSGKVEFISETGDPVPSWMRCHFSPRAIFVNRI